MIYACRPGGGRRGEGGAYRCNGPPVISMGAVATAPPPHTTLKMACFRGASSALGVHVGQAELDLQRPSIN